MAVTSATETDGRIFIDRQSRDAYRALTATAWRDTALFSPRERAALALAEATTRPADIGAQDAAYAEARAALSDDEISAAIWVAITMNAFNRVSVMSKHPVHRDPASSPRE
ncbi:hypothetical protein GLX30_30930 [Streptomyces sp. Tu 2975]|nr:hypothetical protein GLX30_30930 [Streptomyces sp. Tu 2975]